ncbi:Hyaluronidase [Amphibalanus amphitrite]|uniref:Hyaluronidase n=1 Tax=Amphibalanus amphitrite TaxID=1232801 RepID=A0A6A4V6Z4_AMPAM|nr:Hyaluronidase [Amphibalanus amphitrite]
MLLLTLALLTVSPLATSKKTDDSFKVVWNVPSSECANFNVTIDPAQYGFIVNSDGAFRGDRIVLFYNPGLYPQILSNGTRVNGGLPQLGDLRLHLDAFAADVDRYIPDVNFSGLAVIDFEEWTPWFTESPMKYRLASHQAVRDEHPDWPEERVNEQAREDWEWWARLFLEQTLRAAEKARPAALWGYYQYPLCKNLEVENGTCPGNVREHNDQLSWLFGDSFALYPSIYLFLNNFTSENRRDTVIGRLVEARRQAEGLPILPYTWFQYHDDESYLSDEDLIIMLGEPAARGSAGAVMWGSSSNCDTAAQCIRLEEYLRDHLGPIVQTLVELTPAKRDAWRQLLEQPAGRQLLRLAIKHKQWSQKQPDPQRKKGVGMITELELLAGTSDSSFGIGDNRVNYLTGEKKAPVEDGGVGWENNQQLQKIREWQSSLDQQLWEIKRTQEKYR